MTAKPILIVGASARAAAFSAARAGYAPYWLDLYGDADLRERFPGMALDPGDYPRGLVEAAGRLPPMPFMVTGAMENHLAVLDALAAARPLLGNDPAICRAVRDPFALQQCLSAAGLSAPAVGLAPAKDGNWLCKPLRSAGGQDITVYEGSGAVPPGCYLQEYIQGQHVSAVFVGDGQRAWLAGVTRQLVGKAAFHASPFAYCGSLGPIALGEAEAWQWRTIGDAVAGTFGLRGLFGVDAVQRDESIYPVEINPRYTASVEVIEAGTGLFLIEHHVRACGGGGREPAARRQDCFGKCHLFAPARLSIDIDLLTLPMPCEIDAVTLADVPPPGTVIDTGRPVLTLLAGGRDQRECLHLLTEGAAAILERVNGES